MEVQNNMKEIETMKKVILRCYEICRGKEFKNINLSLRSDESVMSRVKQGFKLLDYTDVNSETYKSLLSITRKALAELKAEKHEYYYWYLIQYFCTVPFDKIVRKKSNKVELFPEKKERIVKEEQPVLKPVNDTEIHIQGNITGKKLASIKEEQSELKDWEMNDEMEEEEIDEDLEEYNDEEDNDMEM